MNVRACTKQDLHAINRWLKQRKHQLIEPDQMEWRDRGYIVPGVAAAFLLTIQGMPVGILEGVVSNPIASPQTRDKALNAIYERVLVESKSMKLQGILTFSDIPTIIARSKSHGFVPMPHTLLIKGN